MSPPTSKTFLPFISVFLLAIISFSAEAKGVNIGIVFDGPSDLNSKALAAYKKEIADLTEGEFTVRFPENKILIADWSTAGVADAINKQLTDPGVDIIITLGVIASTEMAEKSALPKPVIAPWVIDPVLLGLAPSEGGGSGIRNLYYLSKPKVLGRDVKKFHDIIGFHNMAIIYMPLMKDLVPGIENSVRKISASEDVVITLVQASATVQETLDAIPPDTQAVYVTPLLNYSDAEKTELYDGLIEKKFPSFSMLGKGEVEMGALVGLTPDHDFTREARRVALVVQSILLGNAAGDYPVEFSEEEILTINMATARAIKFSPSWSLLTEAALINEEPAQKGRTLTLEQAVNASVEVNLDLLAANQFVTAGAQDIKLAMSQLLPQSDVFLDNSYIDKDRAAASLGTQPQRELSVGGNVSQLIYSEKAWSNLTVQRRLQESREFTRDEVRLDIIAATAIGYLNVLRSKTVERIQKENLNLSKSNLELAKVRRDIGVASPAEVYRWDSQISSDRINVVNAEADTKNTEILVNRLLHRPQGEEFTTVETGLEDPSLLVSDPRLKRYISNPADFSRFMDFMVSLGLKQSPAISSIDSQIAAQDRILTSTKRAFWSPTIFAFGELRHFLYEGGAGSSVNIPENFPVDLKKTDDTEWTVLLEANFPLFRGGAKIAEERKARSELSRLRYERDSTTEKVEEQIRTALNASGASFPSIGFALDAAEAAHNNLQIVTDSYSRGVVSIIDLLDAQNAALSADLNAANSVYNFLIDLMNVQRATGKFDFFTSPAERDEWFKMLGEFFNKSPEEDIIKNSGADGGATKKN